MISKEGKEAPVEKDNLSSTVSVSSSISSSSIVSTKINTNIIDSSNVNINSFGEYDNNSSAELKLKVAELKKMAIEAHKNNNKDLACISLKN